MRLAGPVLAILLAPVAALADECPAGMTVGSFVTSKGITLVLPEIDGMTCEEIEITFSKIDATRYRENAPGPHDRSDLPLYCYETRLSLVHYRVCVAGEAAAAKPDEPLRQQAENR